MKASVPTPIAKALQSIGLVDIQSAFRNLYGGDDGGGDVIVVVETTLAGTLYSIFRTVLFVLAVFLSVKRNNGFNLGAFLAACMCTECYIAYALAIPKRGKK